jgi:hypothetical protein
VAVKSFVQNLENLYLYEQPKLESRSAGVKVYRVCESAEECVRGFLRFLLEEIQRNWRSICETEILRMMMMMMTEAKAFWDTISCRLQKLARFGSSHIFHDQAF